MRGNTIKVCLTMHGVLVYVGWSSGTLLVLYR